MIFEYLKTKKILVDEVLLKILSQEAKNMASVGPFGADGMERLREFSTRGKGIRGMLVLLGSEMFGKASTPSIITIAAAMEIIHSSILIQDDIMDNDFLRRGQPSVFFQYEQNGEQERLSDPHLFGQGMASCVFVTGYFAAIKHIAKANIDNELKAQLLEFLSNEIEKVCTAQMQDCHLGFTTSSDVSLEEIKQIYLYKTGRYTFSLPLSLGAIYAGASQAEIAKIEQFGESLGVVFQLIDDNISINSDVAESGKTIGNDIRVNKKTYLRSILFSKTNGADKAYLEKQFGNPDLTMDSLLRIREIIDTSGTKKVIADLCDDLSAQANKTVQSLNITQEYKDILISLVEYNRNRLK
jgi:geranylgeranyl diphosphate synthase, type I